MSNFKLACRTALTASWLLAGILPAQAAVVLNGTRVIYPEAEREAILRATNEGATSSLVQAWIDTGNADAAPDDAAVPFLLTPPLFRLDPGKGQTIRIILVGEPLPPGHESVFWLNVLEVPPSAAGGQGPANYLQFAFRSRIKLFYRPAALDAEGAGAAPHQIRWRFVRKDGAYVLEASNPTPYHVTFRRVIATAGGRTFANGDGGMVAPGGTLDLDIGKPGQVPGDAPDAVSYSFVNDYGGTTSGTADVRRNAGR